MDLLSKGLLGGEFTVEQWQRAELFYQSLLPTIIMVALVVLVFLLLFIFTKSRFKKITVTILSLIIIVCGGLVLIGLSRYSHYTNYTKQINASVRDREKVWIGYRMYDRDHIQRAFFSLKQSDITDLEIYQPVERDQEIEYLGSAHNTYYFMLGANKYSISFQPVFEEVSTAKLVGTQYQLVAEEFSTIGFLSETGIILEKIVIPVNLKDKDYIQEGGKSKQFDWQQTEWIVERD